jgi:apolipoprotein N-acyltransferase
MQKVRALLDKHSRWLALIAGGLSATGFAPLNLWPLTLLCLALLMQLVATAGSGKRAFMLGWLFGIGHFSIGNNWIATAFTYQSAMPIWLGWVAVVLLALYLAVYPALACWGAWWVARLSPLPFRGGAGGGDCPNSSASIDRPHPNPSPEGEGLSSAFILGFAGFWIITEWLRSWVFTGFAWNPFGAVMAGYLAAPAIYIGSYGLSGAIVILAGVMLSLILGNWRLAVLIAIPLALIWVVSFFQFTADTEAAAINGKVIGRQHAALTIVQPNISQIDKYTPGYEAINFSRLALHSRSTTNQPRLLLWPEAAIPWWLEDRYPPFVYSNQPGQSAAGTRAALARLLGPDDILLTGTDRLEFGADGEVAGARNSVLAIDATGKIRATYDKAHLVPYGEYLALRWLLEPLGATRLVPGDIDFWPGPGPRTLNLGKDKPKVGMQICYEIIFSGQVVDRAHRPDFIFNPSNDAWFGSWGSPQFLAQSRLRAIEEGLPVVRATPTGISAIIDADGHVVKSLGTGKAGRIDALLPPAKAPTLFARYGNILPLGLAALLIALAFFPLVRRRRSR